MFMFNELEGTFTGNNIIMKITILNDFIALKSTTNLIVIIALGYIFYEFHFIKECK